VTHLKARGQGLIPRGFLSAQMGWSEYEIPYCVAVAGKVLVKEQTLGGLPPCPPPLLQDPLD
jgi:hypothetical protein